METSFIIFLIQIFCVDSPGMGGLFSSISLKLSLLNIPPSTTSSASYALRLVKLQSVRNLSNMYFEGLLNL